MDSCGVYSYNISRNFLLNSVHTTSERSELSGEAMLYYMERKVFLCPRFVVVGTAALWYNQNDTREKVVWRTL